MRPVQNIIVAIYLASLYNASFFLTYADTIPAHKSLRRLQGGGEMGGQGQAPQQGPEQGGQPQQQGPEQGGQPQQQQGPEGQQGQAPEGQAQQGQAQQGQAQQGQAQQGQAQQGQAQQQGPEGQQGQGQQAQQQGPEQQQQQQQQQQGPEQQQQQQQSQQQQQQNQKTQKNQQNQQQQQQQQQQPQQQQSTYYNYQNQQGSSSTTSTDTTQVVSSDTDTSSSAAQVQPASYSSATSKTSYNNDIHMGVVVGCSVGVAAVVIGLVFVVFRVSAVGNGLFGSDGLAVAPTGKTGRGMDDSADQEVDFTAHSRVALTDVRFQDSPVGMDVSTRDLSSHAARHGLNEPTAKGAGNSAPVRYSSPPNVYYPKTKREKTTIDL